MGPAVDELFTSGSCSVDELFTSGSCRVAPTEASAVSMRVAGIHQYILLHTLHHTMTVKWSCSPWGCEGSGVCCVLLKMTFVCICLSCVSNVLLHQAMLASAWELH